MSTSWQKKENGNKVYSLEVKAMTPQEKQELDQHVQAIAKLLYILI